MSALDARDFEAPVATLFKIITAVVLVVVTAIVAFTSVMAARDGAPLVPLFVLPILIITFGVATLFRPKGYRLTETGIAVARPIGQFEIPYRAIEEVREGSDWLSIGTIGVWRSGGFFGVYGWFWRSGVGLFRAYVSDPQYSVTITVREGRPLVISPKDRTLFVAMARERLGH